MVAAVLATQGVRAPSQYPKRRLFVRSRKVSQPRDWYFKLSYRFEIWQAHRQQCCQSACQISERSDNSNYKSRGFENWRDLMERRLFGYWDGAQDISSHGDGLVFPQYSVFSIRGVGFSALRKNDKELPWNTLNVYYIINAVNNVCLLA